MTSALELMQRRLGYNGGSADNRIVKEKLNSLQKALQYSYQAETIFLNGREQRALLNAMKQKLDYDDKVISIPFDSDIKVGSVFYWPRSESNWIVYLRQYTEDAYFRGYVKKAAHTIKWTDSLGVKRDSVAAVRGPVETKERNVLIHRLSVDEPNYSLYMIVPHNEETEKLTRYSKISLDGKIWEIATTDTVSEPGVIELNLIESFKNSFEDDEYAKGQKEVVYTINNIFDTTLEFEKGKMYEVWMKAYGNGLYTNEVSKHTLEIVKGSSIVLKDYNRFSAEKLGKTVVRFSVPEIGYSKEYTINIVEKSDLVASEIRIVGPNRVKEGTSATYRPIVYINGESQSIPMARWSVVGEGCSIVDMDASYATLKWDRIGKQKDYELIFNMLDVDTGEERAESLIIHCETLM